jgi:hypothetical protein
MHRDLEQKISHVFDRAKHEALALILSQQEAETPVLETAPDWMTAKQLARYWQILDAKGEPTTAGITTWAKRSEDEHPLPHAYMGDLLRFKREDVDRWAVEGAARREVERNRKKIQLAS